MHFTGNVALDNFFGCWESLSFWLVRNQRMLEWREENEQNDSLPATDSESEATHCDLLKQTEFYSNF